MQRLNFGNAEMKRLNDKLSFILRERNEFASISKYVALKVQCVPCLSDDANKLWDRVAELENANRVEGTRLSTKLSKHKKVDLEANLLKARIELDGFNAGVAELGAQAGEFGNRLEQVERKLCDAKSHYLLL